MTAQEAYILAKAYTKKSIEGAGSLKGAACQIKSIEAITGGHRITFEWEDNDGEVSTDTMDVMDGADGNDGVGISSITYKETDAHGNYVYTVTLTDTNAYDIICPKGAQGETGATGATGNGIASIEKTSTAGLVDTYTITYTNGQTTTFTVTNGESITVDSAMSGSSTNPVQNKVITEALADKQDAEDNNLTTEAKTIVGAINEHEGDISSLKSGFTNLDNEVNGDATTYPYADVITIEDAIPSNLADCSVKIEPVQDLHGQSAPYVGGAGKNKLPLVLADIKTANTDGTWSGNAYTLNDVTFTVQTDNDGNVVGILVNGTASNGTSFVLCNTIFTAGSYKLNGCPSGGANTTYRLRLRDITNDNGGGADFELSEDTSIISDIVIGKEYAIPTGGLTFYPMIRLATETDATFAPYTNICPISGHTEVDVQRDGRNLWHRTFVDDGFNQYDTYSQYCNKAGNVETPVIVGQKYTFSIDGVSKQMRYAILDANKNEISGYTSAFTTIAMPSDAKYLKWRSLDDVGSQDVKAQLEIGETVHAYVPYASPQTYTIALGDTIYGGTVDFDSGVMTVDRAYGTYAFSGINDTYSNITYGFIYKPNECMDYNKYNTSAITSHYPVGEKTTEWDDATKIGKFYGNGMLVQYWVGFPKGTTLSEMNEQINSALQICYELATPTTIQLTPQQIQLLKGQNTLTASTGQISVTVNGVSGAIGAVQEQVNGLDSNLTNLIKSQEFTVTTDATGNARLYVGIRHIISAYAYKSGTNALYRVVPFWLNNPLVPSFYGTYIEVYATTDNIEHVKNEEITGVYYYI